MSTENEPLPSFTYTMKKTDCGGRWAGREIRIFRRRGKPNWYVQPGHGGKQHRTVLKTEARETARTLAIEVCDRVWSGLPANDKPKVVDLLPRPSKRVATIGDVIRVYEQKAPRRQKGRRTVRDNVNSLRVVVREGVWPEDNRRERIDNQRVDALSCEMLTPTVVRRFEEGRLARVPADHREGRQSALVSINAYMRAARSIFQDKFRPWYTEDAELVLPDLAGFMSYELTQPKKEPKRKPPMELLRKTFTEEAPKLKAADPEAYYAWLLSVYSLRRSEVQRCQRDWLRREVLEDDADFLAAGEPCWVIRTDRGKSDRERVIPLPDSVALEIIAWHDKMAANRPECDRPYLLPAGRVFADGVVRAGRAQAIIKRVNKWMRGLGWTTRKTLHEMRALFLRKARAEHGMEAAQQLGGHSDPRVTKESYTGDRSLKGVIVEFPGISRKAVNQ